MKHHKRELHFSVNTDSLDNYAWIFLKIGITIMLKNMNHTIRHMMSTVHHCFSGTIRNGLFSVDIKVYLTRKKKY